MFQDMFGNMRYKVGLHTHTTVTDGKVTPEECARIYKEAGYDAIALTDHWKYHGEDEISGLKIISGCEYNLGRSDTSTDVIHIVGVGMREEPQLSDRGVPRQEVIDAIKAKGGLAILAHPAWSLNTPEEIKKLSGFDAVEIYNSVSDVGQSSRPYSGYFVDLLANMGVTYPLIATDDAHYYQGEDETKSYIMVKAEDGSIESILDGIRKSEFYATQGPEVHIRREGDKIIADCSPCVTIDFLSNSAWVADKMNRGTGLVHAQYQIKAWEKWIRVEVKDADGNYGWSNIITIE